MTTFCSATGGVSSSWLPFAAGLLPDLRRNLAFAASLQGGFVFAAGLLPGLRRGSALVTGPRLGLQRVSSLIVGLPAIPLNCLVSRASLWDAHLDSVSPLLWPACGPPDLLGCPPG